MIKHVARWGIVAVLAIASFPIFAQGTDDFPRFGGIWETDRGPMALWQAEDAVWGLYGDSHEIGGHIREDGAFSFSWDEGVDGHGRGWFRLSEDGDSIRGMWLNDLEISDHGTWDGEYVAPNTFPIGDAEALEYEPEEEITPPEEIPEPEPTPEESPAVEGPPEFIPLEVEESPSDEPAEPIEEAPDEEPEEEPDAEPEEEPDEEPVVPPTSSGDVSVWIGTWNTGRDYRVLGVDDDGNIIGSFGESGVLQGTVEGSTLSATWHQTAEDGSVSDGEAVFWLAEDGESFRGTYSMSTEPDVWLVWNGDKMHL